MHVLSGRNINTIWPQAMTLLRSPSMGVAGSRNGQVRRSPVPVTTLYERPMERVLFDARRDANPFFHLFEALWMLAGRNDAAFVSQFVKRMAEFSDDGKTFHSAYGYRWRQHFETLSGSLDQLDALVELLTADPLSRRAVLGIWDPSADLGVDSKDLPCNVSAKFWLDPDTYALNLIVFNRSNDVVWGAYGANVVQFSMLLEYMALRLCRPVGRMWQVSSDWHAYTNALQDRDLLNTPGHDVDELYENGDVRPWPMAYPGAAKISAVIFDSDLAEFMLYADPARDPLVGLPAFRTYFFSMVVGPMYRLWRHQNVEGLMRNNDWHVAGAEWMVRHKKDPHGQVLNWLLTRRLPQENQP